MIVDIVAGARPNFVKIAAILAALARRGEEGGPLRPRLVHTGQHGTGGCQPSWPSTTLSPITIDPPDIVLLGA